MALSAMVAGGGMGSAGQPAAVPGYTIPHGSLEQVASTAIPAALRVVEQIARPLTGVETLMGSPAMAQGIAAEAVDELFAEQRPDTGAVMQNSVGAANSLNWGNMSEEQLRAMQNEIVEALRARGKLSEAGKCVVSNAGRH